MRSSNIGQRLLCTVLCLVMLIGFLPAAPAASAAEAVAETGCDHTSVTWTEVGSNTALSAATFAAGGSFKLTGDVHLADQVTLTAGKKLHIDLNGHVLSADGTLFELNGQEAAKAVALTICDSSAEHSGKVNMKGQDASGIVLTSFGTFNLYGGTLTGSTADSGGESDLRHLQYV